MDHDAQILSIPSANHEIVVSEYVCAICKSSSTHPIAYSVVFLGQTIHRTEENDICWFHTQERKNSLPFAHTPHQRGSRDETTQIFCCSIRSSIFFSHCGANNPSADNAHHWAHECVVWQKYCLTCAISIECEAKKKIKDCVAFFLTLYSLCCISKEIVSTFYHACMTIVYDEEIVQIKKQSDTSIHYDRRKTVTRI